ncbi:MAG: ERCC4 domain-containing protein [Salinigranum sp.]
MGVVVLVDDREPPAVVRTLRDHPEVERVEVERLSAGDIVVGDVGFERKTPADYVRSAMGRTGADLRSQVERLAAAYPHAYVLLEGDLPAENVPGSGVTAAAVRGSIASITARLGVPVLPCSDRPRLVDMAVRLGRKHAEVPSPRPLAAGAVADTREPTAKRMYGCIDGVGSETAARLYAAFPTVESLVAATRADLLAVEGVGPKRAAAIRAALSEDARVAGDVRDDARAGRDVPDDE